MGGLIVDEWKLEKVEAHCEAIRRAMATHFKMLRQHDGYVPLWYVGEFESELRGMFKTLRAIVEA